MSVDIASSFEANSFSTISSGGCGQSRYGVHHLFNDPATCLPSVDTQVSLFLPYLRLIMCVPLLSVVEVECVSK